ncbi:MAG: hypothetical protein ABJ370_09610 [Paracoccaceae bacterium]
MKDMRFSYFLLACLLTMQPAYADVVQVPLIEDGTVNMDEVMSGFQLAFPILEDGEQSSVFAGQLLGQPFSGGVIDANTMQDFTLAIEAPTLSEHGNFLIAVLATDLICLRNGLSPGIVLWSDSKFHNGASWQVSTSCAAATD